MFADSEEHENVIEHSQELHDMLLNGYNHAIIYEVGKAEEKEDQDTKGNTDSDTRSFSKTFKKGDKENDIIYEFDRDGMIFRIEGFKDKETARMAYEEKKEFLARQDYEYRELEQQERLRLLNLQQHLKLE